MSTIYFFDIVLWALDSFADSEELIHPVTQSNSTDVIRLYFLRLRSFAVVLSNLCRTLLNYYSTTNWNCHLMFEGVWCPVFAPKAGGRRSLGLFHWEKLQSLFESITETRFQDPKGECQYFVLISIINVKQLIFVTGIFQGSFFIQEVRNVFNISHPRSQGWILLPGVPDPLGEVEGNVTVEFILIISLAPNDMVISLR